MDTPPTAPAHGTSGSERPTRPRKQKLTALLSGSRRVITEGVDSTMDAYLSSLAEVLRRGIAAKKQGIELPTFLNILRDTAMR